MGVTTSSAKKTGYGLPSVAQPTTPFFGPCVVSIDAQTLEFHGQTNRQILAIFCKGPEDETLAESIKSVTMWMKRLDETNPTTSARERQSPWSNARNVKHVVQCNPIDMIGRFGKFAD